MTSAPTIPGVTTLRNGSQPSGAPNVCAVFSCFWGLSASLATAHQPTVSARSDSC